MGKILVYGDVMLDKFTYGEVRRLNPEGPNPLLNVVREEYKLWWAANVAVNISSLSGNCTLVGALWNDLNSKYFLDIAAGEQVQFLNICPRFQTITKQRFIDNTYHQQLLRVDYEDITLLNEEEENILIELINSWDFSCLLISDYNKWIFSERIFQKIQSKVIKNIKIFIDAKPKHYHFLRDVFLLKPNFKEFCEIIWKNIENTDENIEKYGLPLAHERNSNLIITRWSKWATLIELNEKITHIKTDAKQVFDVTGAGDTFISTVVYFYSLWHSLLESVEYGNKASWVVVGKIWTEKITRLELWI